MRFDLNFLHFMCLCREGVLGI